MLQVLKVLLGDSNAIKLSLSDCCSDCIDHIHLALGHCFIHWGFLMAAEHRSCHKNTIIAQVNVIHSGRKCVPEDDAS